MKQVLKTMSPNIAVLAYCLAGIGYVLGWYTDANVVGDRGGISAVMVMLFFLLVASYLLLMWFVGSLVNLRKGWAIVVIAATCLGVIVVLATTMPNRSIDARWNLLLSRGFTEYGLSPYETTPRELKDDAWADIDINWWDYRMTHGPLWVGYQNIITRFASTVQSAVFWQRLTTLPLLAGSLLVLWELMRDQGRSWTMRTKVMAALILSPFIIQTVLLDLHNDVWMMLGILLSYYLLTRKKFLLSIWLLIVVGFVKYISWLLIPIPVIALMRESINWRVKWATLFILTVLWGGLFYLLYLPYGSFNFHVFGQLEVIIRQGGLNHSLLGTAVIIRMLPAINLTALRLIGFGMGFFMIGWLAVRRRYLLAYTLPLSLILFFATPWFVPWYMCWLILLYALKLDWKLVVVINVFLFLGMTIGIHSSTLLLAGCWPLYLGTRYYQKHIQENAHW